MPLWLRDPQQIEFQTALEHSAVLDSAKPQSTPSGDLLVDSIVFGLRKILSVHVLRFPGVC